jgi:hypothetical protein
MIAAIGAFVGVAVYAIAQAQTSKPYDMERDNPELWHNTKVAELCQAYHSAKVKDAAQIKFWCGS